MSKDIFRLKFDSPDKEQEFVEHYHRKSLFQARFALLIGAVLYGIYGYLDAYIAPDMLNTIWIIRSVICSILLISFGLTYVYRLQHYFQLITCLPGVIAGLCLLIIIGLGGMEADNYYVGLLAIIIWIGNFSTTRFVASFIACMVILLGFYWVFIVHIDIPGFWLLDHSFFMFTVLFISLFANYSLETSNRGEFSANRENQISMEADLVERKRIQESLRKSEQKFRSILENVNSIIYNLTLDGIFTYVSPNWTEILGHDINDVIGKSFEPFIHPDDLPTCLDFLGKVKKSGTKQSNVQYRIKHIDGEYRWHMSNVSPIMGEADLIISFVGSAYDITEQKRAELSLQNYSDRLTLATQAGGVGIWEWEVLNDNLYWDERTCEIFDVNPDEPRKYEDWHQKIHPEDLASTEKALSTAYTNRREYYSEFRIIRSDESVRFIQAAAIMQRDPQRKPLRMVGIIRDVTDRVVAEETSKKNMQVLERFREMAVGREFQMIKLKEEINDLLQASGMESKYRIVDGEIQVNE